MEIQKNTQHKKFFLQEKILDQTKFNNSLIFKELFKDEFHSSIFAC